MNDYLRTKIKVLSFFLVILVVIVHAYNNINLNTTDPEILHPISGLNGFIQEFFCQGINRIASPLFFIISGFLFFVNITGQKEDFTRKVKKRFFTLLIPYLFWSVWGLLFYIILQALLPSSVSFARGIIVDYDLGKLLNTIFLDPIPYQLWYVRDLTVFALLSPLIYLLLRYLKFFLILILLFIWFYDFDFVIFRNQSAIFFAFGAYVSHRDMDLINRKSNAAAIVFTILWILVNLFKTTLIYDGYQNLIMLIIIHKISIVLGVLSVNSLYNILFSNYEKITEKKMFMLVSYSFFLFASHEPITTVLKKGLIMMLGTSDAGLFTAFIIAPVLAITICIYTGYHLKRLVPRFYGTITGWR